MPTDPSSQPSFSPGRRWKIGLDVMVRTALVLAVVVMTNYLSAHFFGRFYLSSQTRVKLSSQTLDILKSLTNHIDVTLYYDKQDDFYPTIVALLTSIAPPIPAFRQTVDTCATRARRKKSRNNTSLTRRPTKTWSSSMPATSGSKLSTVTPSPQVKDRAGSQPEGTRVRRKRSRHGNKPHFDAAGRHHRQAVPAYFLQRHPQAQRHRRDGAIKYRRSLSPRITAGATNLTVGTTPSPWDAIAHHCRPRTNCQKPSFERLTNISLKAAAVCAFSTIFPSSVRRTGADLARWGVQCRPRLDSDPKNNRLRQGCGRFQFQPASC